MSDNDLSLDEATSQANGKGLEGKYRGTENLFRAALKKLKYPSEVISLLEPHFNKEYTKEKFHTFDILSTQNKKNINHIFRLTIKSATNFLKNNN